ncbi:MAG: hypothetical protein L0216_21050 [Planctomycetales bacterium]|nr:hypothetical protein [Planctomycetales bacterium]
MNRNSIVALAYVLGLSAGLAGCAGGPARPALCEKCGGPILTSPAVAEPGQDPFRARCERALGGPGAATEEIEKVRAARAGEPAIAGRVIGLLEEGRLAGFSVGLEDGVLPGDRFKIWRDRHEIGFARVEKVLKDLSAARLEPGAKAIQLGDECRTRWEEAEPPMGSGQRADEAREIQGKLAETEGMLAELERWREDLRRKLGDLAPGGGVGPVRPKPPLRSSPSAGRVIGVSDQYNLVMLSVGENDGVREGYEFTVTRGKDFVGRVRVDKVFPDMCAASELEDYRRIAIQKGDQVRTRTR